MNWFKKHLNLTLLIIWLGLPLAIGLISNETLSIIILPWILTALVTALWVLNQKGRSWAWILLAGLGFIIILFLKNKKTPSNIH